MSDESFIDCLKRYEVIKSIEKIAYTVHSESFTALASLLCQSTPDPRLGMPDPIGHPAFLDSRFHGNGRPNHALFAFIRLKFCGLTVFKETHHFRSLP